MRLEGDGLVGVGDPGGFPVGGGQACAAGVFLAQRGGRAGGQNAELVGQPGLGAGGQLLAEGAGPVIQGGGELTGDRERPGGCAPRPGDVVPGQPREGELLQAVVQHAGDGPGLMHRRGGDPVDEGADVVSGDLRGAEPLLEGLAGVIALVPAGFGFGEPGFDPLVDLRVQGMPGSGGTTG